MKSPVKINLQNGDKLFYLEQLTSDTIDEGVLAFYQKNGFIPNTELLNKNRKTISMRKDIYQ